MCPSPTRLATGRIMLLQNGSQSASDFENGGRVQGILPGNSTDAVRAKKFRFPGHVPHYCNAIPSAARQGRNQKCHGLPARADSLHFVRLNTTPAAPASSPPHLRRGALLLPLRGGGHRQSSPPDSELVLNAVKEGAGALATGVVTGKRRASGAVPFWREIGTQIAHPSSRRAAVGRVTVERPALRLL